MLVGRGPWGSLAHPLAQSRNTTNTGQGHPPALPRCVLQDGVAPPPWWHVPQLHPIPGEKPPNLKLQLMSTLLCCISRPVERDWLRHLCLCPLGSCIMLVYPNPPFLQVQAPAQEHLLVPLQILRLFLNGEAILGTAPSWGFPGAGQRGQPLLSGCWPHSSSCRPGCSLLHLFSLLSRTMCGTSSQVLFAATLLSPLVSSLGEICGYLACLVDVCKVSVDPNFEILGVLLD